MLTIALPKGALLKDSIELCQKVGLDFSLFLSSSNRQLQIEDSQGLAKALLVRAQDVPVYVEYGQAHLGVVGYDVLKEKKANIANVANLGFGYCRMSVAVPENSPYRSSIELPAHGIVASKFVNCAKEYFRTLDLPVEIVPLYGSVELGPITGMSEAIVDLVSTGKTLRENGLIEIDVLFESSAYLVANPLTYRLNTYNLNHWVKKLIEKVN
ncbi:MAG: ATP phosphoribosyltransferase [Cyanobacteria bacterium]|nr:ATP phosphoribosyltransferase [Cyanobacteria bacterium CG_2015-16_32_12]NCO79040.1 ATP phosphoribosyltransferase [Cyanobacteria bacterium CG_2015-22_32_23]NCQ04287.1 ATP phosphoribosyltransferase [Cyanobacteria bacterium CG_2015-09_32_10]NCQ41575.1 ATP phosphoribosyltransferase [Cyanobacteria bacterium CG_2015-04_32_10]NCS85677.1 ATP phosphoribosyltransferase [Cyanobacteria bacterium CG_2015-02_32_10]